MPNSNNTEASTSANNQELNQEFLFACRDGKLDKAVELLKTNLIDINCSGILAGPPLAMACISGQIEIVEMLLNHSDIDVNKVSSNGCTPLHLACSHEHIEIVKMLLTHQNTDVNKPDKKPQSPLHGACTRNQKEAVKLLLTHKDINVNQTNFFEDTPLHLASCDGFEEIVEILLSHQGIEVNKTNRLKNTALLEASFSGHKKVVELLLANPAINFIKTDDEGKNPLHWACSNDHKETVDLLLNHQAIKVGYTHLSQYSEDISHHSILFSFLQHQKLIIPSIPENSAKKHLNDTLQATLKSPCEYHKKNAVLLYIRGFKPENPEKNDLYQNWLRFEKQELLPNTIEQAIHPVSTLQELSLFTINKHVHDTNKIPSAFFKPPKTMSDIVKEFFSYLAHKERQLQNTEEPSVPTPSL